VLEQYYDQTAEFMEYVMDDPKLGKITEDCIDALCLAVTGMLGLKKGFKSIPATPMTDRRGILMQMVYAETE
jgi:predicted RNase H-like nuclease